MSFLRSASVADRWDLDSTPTNPSAPDPRKSWKPAPSFAFGSFQFDPARGMLYRNGTALPLPERLVQLLTMLIHANGMLLDKEAIASALWPADGSVTDANIAQHMYMLRQLLRERASDRNYIVTVRGRGYRFVAPIRAAGSLRAGLTGEADEDAPDRLLRNAPELQHHYWRGCNLLEKRTATALATAVDQFEAALRIDGDNVPSLIALARSHMLIAEHWYAPTCYAFSKAKAAIVRALELDPASGEAQAVLGDILLHCDWNWVEAERHIETAVEISPKSSVVNATAAWFYVCKGDREQALRRTQQVSLIESSSPSLQLFLARIFLHTGDVPRAIEVLSNLIESRSDFSIARRYRAQAYILSGRPGEALTDLLLLPQERADDIAQRLPLLARAYADCGDRERAESIYRSLLDLAATEYIAGFNLATVAVGLGRYDEALDHLSWALQRREAALLMLRSLTWFEPVARHARFRTLLRTIWPGEPVAKIRS